MARKKLLFLCIVFTVIKAQGIDTEKIVNFHSDIIIDTTGRVEITESITIKAEGREIKRGIVRSIPVYRNEKDGRKKNMDFRILNVMLNEEQATYHIENRNGYKEIFTGSSDVLLNPGIYTYTIVYETDGHIGFFDSYDELYWNVTGNEWSFPIDQASATISLPDGALFLNAACYTGKYGETNGRCYYQEDGGKYLISTNKKLLPNEGFTIAIAFSPHLIKRPPPPSLMERLWEKYGNILYTCVAMVFLLLFYIITWKKVGKDPEKPVVVPSFDPPHGWNAPTVRRLYRKSHEKKALTVALVDMAVKRLIRIRQETKKYWGGSTYILEKLTRDETGLQLYESRIIKNLFPEGINTISVTNKNHARFNNADHTLERYTFPYLNDKVFQHNYKYAFTGILFTLILLILFIKLFTSLNSIVIFLTYIIFLIGGILGAQSILGTVKQGRIFKFITGMIFIILAFCAQQMYMQISMTGWFHTAFIFFVQLSAPLYFILIKAPTQLGLQIEADLNGFRMYLKTAEENRLNLLTPPDHTPELFEKLLPYAIALDVENEWGKKFNKLLKQVNYAPDWYQSTSGFQAATFGKTLTHSFGSSLMLAKTDPAATSTSGSSGSGNWSSGSSGGGFSGGGGGGGGGRGW